MATDAVPQTILATARIDRTDRWPIAGLTVVALGVCLVRIGDADLWLDEAFSVAGSGDLGRSWTDRGGSMGLYYSLLNVWAEPTSSAGWVRLPSAVFAAATIPFVYLLARAVGGRRLAVTACVLLVVSWGFVRYGQEARAYSMAMLLVTASWWLLVRNLEARRSALELVAHGAVSALVGYAQPLALLAVAPQLVVLVLAERPLATLRRFAVSGVTATVGLVPLALLILNAPDAGPTWVQPLNLRQLQQLHTQLGGSLPAGSWLLTAAIGAGIVIAVVAVVGTGSGAGRWRPAVPLAWFTLPVLGLVAVSLVEPYFVARYLVPITPAASLLAAMALVRLPPRAAVAATVVVASLMAVSVVRLWDHPREEWAAVVATVSDPDRPSTVLFADPELRVPFEHALITRGGPAAVRPLMPPHEWGDLPRYLPERSLDDEQRRLDELDSVWIIDRGHDEDGDPVAGRVAETVAHPALDGWCPQRATWFRGGLVAVELVHARACL